MSPKENKDKVRYYLTEIWYNHNLDVLNEVLHPDFVAHSNPPSVGIEAVKQAWKTGILEALSEKKIEFPHQLVENGLLVEGWPYPVRLGMMQQLGYKLTLEDS